MLSRRQFNGLVAAGAGACFVGCTAGAAPDGTVTPTNGQAVLTFAQFPQLATAGGTAVVDVNSSFPIVVVRTSDTVVTALSATCTHAGCLVEYSTGAEQLHCPCHNASFNLQGAVLSGPTTIPLPVYTATLGADGITVQIS
ncbi:MAG: Rieske (2Fe-2S) domain protein [bacterium]|nr:Rieske (2Fe-2S) domain protein [bacterium]